MCHPIVPSTSSASQSFYKNCPNCGQATGSVVHCPHCEKGCCSQCVHYDPISDGHTVDCPNPECGKEISVHVLRQEAEAVAA